MFDALTFLTGDEVLTSRHRSERVLQLQPPPPNPPILSRLVSLLTGQHSLWLNQLVPLHIVSGLCIAAVRINGIQVEGAHDSGSRARSTATLEVQGAKRPRAGEVHRFVVILLTDTSAQAVRSVWSSAVPLGVGVCGQSLVLDHRNC